MGALGNEKENSGGPVGLVRFPGGAVDARVPGGVLRADGAAVRGSKREEEGPRRLAKRVQENVEGKEEDD